MTDRLLELAREGARERHEEAFAMEDDYDAQIDSADQYWELIHEGGLIEPIAWMPLPSPPQEPR